MGASERARDSEGGRAERTRRFRLGEGLGGRPFASGTLCGPGPGSPCQCHTDRPLPFRVIPLRLSGGRVSQRRITITVTLSRITTA
jgi:hypothetical protein